MIANFGTKLVRFVASKKKGYRVPGQGAHAAKITRSLGMPFRYSICILETVQDFLIKLSIKPLMHLLEIPYFLI